MKFEDSYPLILLYDAAGGRFGTPRTDRLRDILKSDPDKIVPLLVK